MSWVVLWTLVNLNTNILSMRDMNSSKYSFFLELQLPFQHNRHDNSLSVRKLSYMTQNPCFTQLDADSTLSTTKKRSEGFKCWWVKNLTSQWYHIPELVVFPLCIFIYIIFETWPTFFIVKRWQKQFWIPNAERAIPIEEKKLFSLNVSKLVKKKTFSINSYENCSSCPVD